MNLYFLVLPTLNEKVDQYKLKFAAKRMIFRAKAQNTVFKIKKYGVDPIFYFIVSWYGIFDLSQIFIPGKLLQINVPQRTIFGNTFKQDNITK